MFQAIARSRSNLVVHLRSKWLANLIQWKMLASRSSLQAEQTFWHFVMFGEEESLQKERTNWSRQTGSQHWAPGWLAWEYAHHQTHKQPLVWAQYSIKASLAKESHRNILHALWSWRNGVENGESYVWNCFELHWPLVGPAIEMEAILDLPWKLASSLHHWMLIT